VLGHGCGHFLPVVLLDERHIALEAAIEGGGVAAYFAADLHISYTGFAQANLDTVDHGFHHIPRGFGVGVCKFQRKPWAGVLEFGLADVVDEAVSAKNNGAGGFSALERAVYNSGCAALRLAVKFQPMKNHNVLSFRTFAVTAVVVCTIVIAGCAETVNTRGQIILPSRLAQVQTGVSTKQDVLQLLGSPSTQGTMNENRWYYITSSVGTTSFTPHDLKSRQIVIIDFDANDVVATLTQKGKDDGKQLEPEKEATETHGQALGIVDQFIGNLGGLIKE
jgi:outer membrane protein assembly factor BamE (lipoprotein component of BamABCDE complex)